MSTDELAGSQQLVSNSSAQTSTNQSSSQVSLTRQVYQELRRLIITGAIEPDRKLKVDELKNQLNAGASPIREALSLLTSDQLVQRIDQRGFRVAPVSETHFQEILTLRCQLEELALRSSIVEGDSQWEENLVLTHHRLSRTERFPAEPWELEHKAYHRALIDACDSPILLRFCDQLYDLNIRYRYLAGQSDEYSKREVAAEHENLMQATLDRDADAATNLLKRHYNLTGGYFADRKDHSPSMREG